MSQIFEYFKCLTEPKFAKPAVRVALFVGTLLFIINHGAAVIQGEMSRERWISGLLTYIVPYMVNIHGQFISRVGKN